MNSKSAALNCEGESFVHLRICFIFGYKVFVIPGQICLFSIVLISLRQKEIPRWSRGSKIYICWHVSIVIKLGSTLRPIRVVFVYTPLSFWCNCDITWTLLSTKEAVNWNISSLYQTVQIRKSVIFHHIFLWGVGGGGRGEDKNLSVRYSVLLNFTAFDC